MKISVSLFVSAFLVSGGNSSNPTSAPTFFDDQGEICKDAMMEESTVRMIKPSDADNGRIGPIRPIGSRYFSTNREHYVIGYPNGKQSKKRSKKHSSRSRDDYLNVFLHGTTSSPYRHTCHLKSISRHRTTIGLSYATLNAPDGARNTMCGNEPDTAQCLTDNHIQAIEGGDFRGHLWEATDPRDSITGRLQLLLKHLDEKYPDEGWDRFYIYEGTKFSPVWEKIVISGHSQGASHSAYLAQSTHLAGAALYSGPQDLCIGCPKNTKLWVDDPFKTYAITGMAHGDPAAEYEPLIPVITDNWKRMALTGTITWSIKDEDFEPIDIGYGTKGGHDVCHRPVVSFITPAETGTCGRAGHCSISVDHSVPLITRTDGEFVPVYELHAWPEVGDAPKCN